MNQPSIDPILSPNSAGAMLGLIHTGQATSRAQIMELTGLSRSTVTNRLDTLLASGYLCTGESGPSTGGRPQSTFQTNKDFGVMLLADIGAQQMQIALADMHGQCRQVRPFQIDVCDGPETILGQVGSCFQDLLKEAGLPREAVKGIGLGVPSPVEYATGRLVRPPLMINWDGCCVPEFFRPAFTCPITVDKDVNLMALGEYRRTWPDASHLMFITIGTGIGAGIVMNGRLQRGAQGAAGDIGHLYVGNSQAGTPPVCRCGNTGCLEAYASGWALTRKLEERGYPRRTLAEIAQMAHQGDQEVVNLLQSSGRLVGDVLAQAVSLLNPSLVVLGGTLAECQDHLLAGVRATIYQRSLPLATRELQIVGSSLGDQAALSGAACLVSDLVFAPAAVNRDLAQQGN